MMPEEIFSGIIVGIILGCAAGIFAYLKNKFKCQDEIKRQIKSIDNKVEALIGIYKIILTKTHPEEVEKFETLLKLAVKD